VANGDVPESSGNAGQPPVDVTRSKEWSGGRMHMLACPDWFSSKEKFA
jgi:hypothetical protein